jgi:hypothetical protein
MTQDKGFTVWLGRPKYSVKGTPPAKQGTHSFMEPAEAADYAENVLKLRGEPGISFAELRLNGEKEPQTIIFYLEADTYGIWNTDNAEWPIYYGAENPYGVMLDGNPFVDDEGRSSDDPDYEKESGLGDESDDSDVLDLGAEPEGEDEGADEDEDAEDEIPTPDDEGEEEIPDDEGEDEQDEDGDEDEDDADEDDENDDDKDEDESEADEEEAEMPRLAIFAKMRGPLGWRKRAEAEELANRNVFSMKLGVVDHEREKTSQQEREVFAQVDFIEHDEDRTGGLLRLRLPDGITLADFEQKGRNLSVRIPYRSEG